MSWKGKGFPPRGGGPGRPAPSKVRKVAPKPGGYVADMRRRATVWAWACAASFLAVVAVGWVVVSHLPPAGDGAPPAPPPPPGFEEAEALPPPPPWPPEPRTQRARARATTVAKAPANLTHRVGDTARSAPQFAQPVSAVDGVTSAAQATPALMFNVSSCDFAARRSEQMVCRDGELARYQAELARTLARAAQAGTPQWWLAAEQDRWAMVDRERAAERSRGAVVELYRQRIAELEQLATRR